MGLRGVLGNSGGRSLWVSVKEGFSPEFVAEVDRLLRKGNRDEPAV
jgi:hypothetical protein